MSRTQRRNNVLAGLFLVGALVLTVFISFWIEEGFDKLPFVSPRSDYIVRFTLRQGVAGLKPGSPVTLGGREIGSVSGIDYELRSPDGSGLVEPVAVRVTVSVDKTIGLYDNADVFVVSPIFGTLSSINITDIGGGDGAVRMEPGGVVPGRTSPAIAGLPDLGALASQAEEFLTKITAVLDEVSPDVAPIKEDIRVTLSNARDFAGALRENQDRWFDKADSILAGADAVFGQTIPSVAEEVSGGVADARRLVGSAQDMLDENRDDLRRTVSNLEGMSERVRYDILGRMERVLDEGLIAAANLGDIGDRVLGAIDRVEPPLVRTVSNFQLASSQVLLLAEEIRAAPYRALKQPSEKEQREEVLFSAVRRYAGAVETLRDASASLDSVLHGARLGGREVPREQIDQMSAELRRSFDELTAAEQSLLSLIARQTGDGAASGGR